MKFRLAIAIHNHQPVGNFSAVFEEAHRHCYLPFLELLSRFPALKISLHQSGVLWDWQKEHHPEFFRLVGSLVDREQVELLSGAFYEPILPAIPDRDKVGQMNLMNAYLRRHFEVHPRGMWLAERVWEPHLPRVINECGLKYLPLDDTHFKYAGLTDKQLFGSYVTEEEGKAVTLLPILKKLRYLIPFGSPDEIIRFLSEGAVKHPGAMAVYADDGEKFGVWPGTFQHCFQEKWLERFFERLSECADWLEVVSLGQAVEESEPLGRIYLPTAAYSEMLHWALPTDGFIAYEEFERFLEEKGFQDQYGHFVRGGHWRSFLTKYPEANLMHKKMLLVSDLLAEAELKTGADPKALENARHLLYAGQCNCAYWHGVFGGLYLPHLRWAIYHRLIRAESILREMLGKRTYVDFTDFDRDGVTDILWGNEQLGLVISPRHGGQILELDILSKATNVADCLARRPEGYHRKLSAVKPAEGEGGVKSIHDLALSKEPGLEKLLAFDTYLRRPLADHFLPADITVADFNLCRYRELGDFLGASYESSYVEDHNGCQVILSRRGNVRHGDALCPLRLEKTIFCATQGNVIDIRYLLCQNQRESLPVNFAVEFDLNLLAPDAEDRYVLVDGTRGADGAHLAAIGETASATAVMLVDEYQDVAIKLESSFAARIWRMPIYTISLSEGGFEKIYQGTSILFLFDRTLASGQEFTVSFMLAAGPRQLTAEIGRAGHCQVPRR